MSIAINGKSSSGPDSMLQSKHGRLLSMAEIEALPRLLKRLIRCGALAPYARLLLAQLRLLRPGLPFFGCESGIAK